MVPPLSRDHIAKDSNFQISTASRFFLHGGLWALLKLRDVLAFQRIRVRIRQ